MQQIYLVHGDLDQAEKLSGGLRETGFASVMIPARGDSVVLS
jgi:hypothetical protein